MGGVAAGEFGGMNLGGGGGGFAPAIEPPVPEIVPPVLPPNISPQEFELAQMLQRGQEHQSILPPPPERGIPVMGHVGLTPQFVGNHWRLRRNRRDDRAPLDHAEDVSRLPGRDRKSVV